MIFFRQALPAELPRAALCASFLVAQPALLEFPAKDILAIHPLPAETSTPEQPGKPRTALAAVPFSENNCNNPRNVLPNQPL